MSKSVSQMFFSHFFLYYFDKIIGSEVLQDIVMKVIQDNVMLVLQDQY